MRENGERKVQAGYQRGWGSEKSTPKELIYVEAEQLWDKRKEEAA